MSLRSVITLTTSPPGGGKSYIRCARELVDHFLVETDRRFITNFPIGRVPDHHPFPPQYEGETFIDRIAAEVAKKRRCEVAEIRDRIEMIPEHVVKTWVDGTSGPSEYFANRDIQNSHIALDEMHVYAGKFAKTNVRDQWAKFLGEIRHRGATIELITQAEDKLAKELINDIGAKLQIVKKDDEREPFFGILMGDWYELRAGFLTGSYTSCVAELEFRDGVDKKGNSVWKLNRVRRWWMTPDYFRFYDSHNAPHSGKGTGASSELKEFQKRTKLGLLKWFVLRNFEPLAIRLVGTVLVFWLLLGGGFLWALESFTGSLKAMANKNGVASHVQKPSVPSGTIEGSVSSTSVPPSPATTNLKASGDAVKHAERRAEKAERSLSDSFAIGLLTQSEVTFRGGYTYAVGDLIDFGPYAGRSVSAIEWNKRAVRLSDGTMLRMAVALDAGSSAGVYKPGEVKSEAPMARGNPGPHVR